MRKKSEGKSPFTAGDELTAVIAVICVRELSGQKIRLLFCNWFHLTGQYCLAGPLLQISPRPHSISFKQSRSHLGDCSHPIIKLLDEYAVLSNK